MILVPQIKFQLMKQVLKGPQQYKLYSLEFHTSLKCKALRTERQYHARSLLYRNIIPVSTVIKSSCTVIESKFHVATKHNCAVAISATNMLIPCSLQKERVKTIETELDGYRNSISSAQATNEQLTLMQNRIEADISMVKKMIGVSLNKQEILKTDYSKYSRMLHETEQALNKTRTVSFCIPDCTVLSSLASAFGMELHRVTLVHLFINSTTLFTRDTRY